jgi:hypothetical protein
MKQLLITTALLACITAAHAGRPLLVDDANVNEKGTGHVEAWFEKSSFDKSLTIAPTYAIIKDLELSLAYNRDLPYTATITAVGAKYQLTKPQKDGCHAAASVGFARTTGNNGMGFNLIATCNYGGPDIHLNLGAARESGLGRNTRTLGLAAEQVYGSYIAHAEALAQQHVKPIFQIGARREKFYKNWQLDGTLGVQGGHALFSVGTKYPF